MPIKDKTGQSLTIQLPSLVATKEFVPTGLMIRTLCAYLQVIENDELKSPTKILSELKHSTHNWYNWHQLEGFRQWWNKAVSDYHSNTGLTGVYCAIYRRAKKDSSADAKLYLERFDDEYKPTSVRELDVYPGRRPADKTKAVENSRKRIESISKTHEDPGSADDDSEGQSAPIGEDDVDG